MATSMDVDGMASDQPATLRELPQVQETSIIHTGLPLSNGMICSTCCCHFRAVRLTSLDAQAPSTATRSEKSPPRFIFGGLTKTLGYTWGVLQSRWIQQDTLLKSVSNLLCNFAQPRTDILTWFPVVRMTSTDKVLTVFGEVSCGSFLQGHPGLLTINRAANCKPKNAATLLWMGAFRGPR